MTILEDTIDAISNITAAKKRIITHCIVSLNEFKELVRYRGDGAEMSRCPDTGQVSINSAPILIAERMTSYDVPADSYVSSAAYAIFAAAESSP